MDGWKLKSESDVDQVWVELDDDGNETGTAVYEIAGQAPRVFIDGVETGTVEDGRLTPAAVPWKPPASWRPRWQRWSLNAAKVAGIVALAEIVHRAIG